MKSIYKSIMMIFFAFSQLNAATITVTGNITANTDWVNTNIYVISGEVYVKNGATLSIQAGTIIQGDKNSTRPCLIVSKGAKIYANGTAALPIVFTSNQPVGQRNPGDWGGIVILGNGVINVPGGKANIEGLPASTDAEYGGSDNNDSSGVLRYVRIEFGGIAFAPNQEINGLTCGAVGKRTVIENVQVSFSGDDAFEFFGGAVNAKNLVSFCNLDDDFDTDFGYSGNLQFGVCFRSPFLADVSGSNGFESDNDASGTYNAPRTMANISNFTMIGPKATLSSVVNSNFKRGAHLRRSSLESIFNSVTIGWPIGLLIDGGNCEKAASNDTLMYLNNIIGGCNTKLIASAGAPIDSSVGMQAWFDLKSVGSVIFSTSDSVGLTSPFDSAAFNPMPKAGSPALTGASFSHPRLAGFENVTHRGAFGATNWMSTWASFTPNANVYKAQTSGISSNSLDAAIAVYPNPSSSVITVAIDLKGTSAQLNIFDMQGRLVMSESIKSNVQKVSVNQLEEGNYLVQVKDAQEILLGVKHIVVKKD